MEKYSDIAKKLKLENQLVTNIAIIHALISSIDSERIIEVIKRQKELDSNIKNTLLCARKLHPEFKNEVVAFIKLMEEYKFDITEYEKIYYS